MNDLIKLTKNSDLVGISLMSNFWDNAIQITRKVKQNHNIPVVWGGTHPTVRPDECLDHADMVCIGESEEAMIELTRKMEKGEYYYNVKGMGFKTNEKKSYHPDDRRDPRDYFRFHAADLSGAPHRGGDSRDHHRICQQHRRRI